MSLDAFEARLQFIKLLKTLNASQASIVKVVSFAIKYGPRCGEDLWTCVVDEVDKVCPQLNPNHRPTFLRVSSELKACSGSS